MNFPENLWYSKEHAWLLHGGNTAKVGITDFAQIEPVKLFMLIFLTSTTCSFPGLAYLTLEEIKINL